MYKQITTVQEALNRTNNAVDMVKMEEALSFVPDNIRRGMIALATLQIVVAAVNNDDPAVPEWKADFNDRSQYKWYPWYNGGSADGSGSGFSFCAAVCGWAVAVAFGGARLALKDEERAEHMNEHFNHIYKDLWLILS